MTKIGTRLVAAAALAGGLALTGCEAPPMQFEQTGYRGTGMAQVEKNGDIRRLAALNIVPPPPYPLEASMLEGERASQAYQNVQVLGDLSAEEFNRLMQSITEWVSPEGKVANGGCTYCHNAENYAADTYDNGKPIYTKIVARRMIQMNRNINTNWQSHVQATGVTCWTCHRGNPVPVNAWVLDPAQPQGAGMNLRGNKRGQNTPVPVNGFASLPYDPFGPYLAAKDNIRVASASAYPSVAHQTSIQSTEHTYALMIHMSEGLGVNCTYCHNTQSFKNWGESRPQRVGAWYGIRMTRDINNNYIEPLAPVFPTNRKGPAGDPLKVNCATCHQGAAKPLNGVSMLKDHPALAGVRGQTVSATATSLAGSDVPTAQGAVASFATAIPAGVQAVAADPRATLASCNAGFQQLLTGAEVQFDTDSASIRPEGRPLLDRLATLAGRCSAFRLTIAGHTDVTASQATNLPLSRDRAGAVASYLVSRGVPPSQLAAIGYGESRPKAAGEGDGANQVNRRIEVTAGAAGPAARTVTAANVAAPSL